MLLGELIELVENWRREAGMYRHRGARSQAKFLESCAEDLEEKLGRVYSAALPPAEAAALIGYTEVSITRYVDAGDVELVDTPDGPAVRLIELPVKAGRLQAVLGDLPAPHKPEEPLRLEAARQAARKRRIKKLA